MPRAPGVYVITNTITGKVYVGASMNVFLRVRQHRVTLDSNKRSNRHLQKDYIKYGKESFKVELLEAVCDISILHEREGLWIDKLNALGSKGYNVANVDDQGNMLGGKTEWWVVFPPNKEPELIRSLYTYAAEHNLCAANLSKISSGKQAHSKGYWVRRALPEEVDQEIVIDTNKPEFQVKEYNPTGEKYIVRHGDKFRVTLSIKNKRYHIGIFDTLEEAVKKRDWALNLSIEGLTAYRSANSIKREQKKTSQYKGVCWDPAGYGRWTASIRVNGKQIVLGRFTEELEAAACYERAELLKLQLGKDAQEVIEKEAKKRRQENDSRYKKNRGPFIE